MNHLRTCFEVQGNLKFLSHLDTLKLVERALRRAGVPVVFSQGFNPHPQIAFGPPKPVGLASTCEYFDVELKDPVDPLVFQQQVLAECPSGFVIKETKEIPLGTGALMAVINCATYRVKIKCRTGISQEEINESIREIMQREEIISRRISPKGTKDVNIRPLIWKLSADITDDGAVVEMEVMIGSSGNVKPGEVINALGLNDCETIEMVRTGLFIRLQNGEKVTPF